MSVYYVVLGPLLAVVASVALGRVLVRWLRVELHREEEWVLGFVAGAAGLSVLVAAVAAAGYARKGAFVGLAVTLAALALWRARKPAAKRLPPVPWPWAALLVPLLAIFAALYFANAIMPETAGGERLGLAFREWHTYRLAAFPDGMRMLFLFAFSFGRHPAAAVVHLVFLAALALAVLCFGRRHGSPGVGAFAAVAVFTAPVAGVTAAGALDDAALACALFAVFYLLEARRGWALAVLPAVFALSLRHTMPAAFVVRGPRELALWGTEAGGLLGPVFLLAALSLLALRHRCGRRVLPAAAVLVVAGAADARWMIPALPFLALAVGFACERSRGVLPVLAVAAALFSWPSVVAVYAEPRAWRIEGWPVPEPAQDYLHRRVPGYTLALLIEEAVPEGGRVLALSPAAHAYTRHEVVSDPLLRETVLTPLRPALQPSTRLRFAFARRPARRLRVVGRDGGGFTVAEFRVRKGGEEVSREAGWRLRAVPDARAAAGAFDNSYVTRWSGSALEAVLPASRVADAVVLECPPGQPAADLLLFVDGEPAGAPSIESVRPSHLRQAAVEELRRHGIRYLAVANNEDAAADLRANAAVWGLLPVMERYDARVYRLE